MNKFFALFTIVALVFAVNSQAASNGSWGEYTGQVLNIENVTIHAVSNYASSFKKGNNTLGGPGGGPGQANFAMDGYTQPPGLGSPTLFTLEQYSFSGGQSATITHVTVVSNAAGPWPTPVSLAYAWQDCNNGVIFPDLPDLLGTSIDGTTLALTLPFSGFFYIQLDVSGIAPGTYDWGWMARYDGLTPIPVPPAPDTDIGGFEFGGGSMALHNLSDSVGDGLGSGRPWCLEVTP